MKDKSKTKKQLLDELEELRRKVLKLETLGTEHKKVLESFMEGEERFRILSQASLEAIVISEKGKILDANSRFAEMFGYELSEVIGRHVTEMVAPEWRELVLHNNLTGYEEPYESVALRKDGSTFDVVARGKYIPYQGRMVRVTSIRDITYEKRSKEAVLETKSFYERLVGDAGDAVVALDRSANIITWNLGAEKIFGYSAREALGRHGRFLVPEEEMERGRAIKREVLAGSTVSSEMVRRIAKDGSLVDGLATYSPLKDLGGQIVGFCSIFKDIREMKRTEEELRRANQKLQRANEVLERAQATALAAEKLAALGRLTAGVSHEILNPLNVVTMGVHLLMSDPATPEAMVGDLQVVHSQAQRIAKIAQDLLYFGRQRPPERRELDFNDMVVRTLGLIEHEFKLQCIEVELRLDEELPPVFADQDQVQQVILNLLNNAGDAIGEKCGGLVILSTAVVREAGEEFVELRVEDSGPGIHSDHAGRIFEPFFSTKPEGEGTGLGLAICQGIVEAHRGTIRAENLPHGGAVFIVRVGLGRSK